MGVDIVEINDDFHRALEVYAQRGTMDCEASYSSFVEGIELISKRISSALEKNGIVEMKALNSPFDPNFHEAVSIIESEDVDEDTVTEVFQKGYVVGDMVVRSAKVIVSKPIAKKKAEFVSENSDEASEEDSK